MSWPPARTPSRTRGCRLARAAYTAAVRPAGPGPTITPLRDSSCIAISAYPTAARGVRFLSGGGEAARGGVEGHVAGVLGPHPDRVPVESPSGLAVRDEHHHEDAPVLERAPLSQ